MLSSLTPRTLVVLLLSVLHISIAVAVDAGLDDVQALAPRQSPTANALFSPICLNYGMVANLSTIGLNSTYRAAFLRSAPMGTDAASSILDTQSPKLPALMKDVNLNQQCGNLSQVAIVEAANNFSRGIVSEFAIQEAPGVGVDGAEVPITVGLVLLVMGGTFLTL
jgi:hypothetical protein